MKKRSIPLALSVLGWAVIGYGLYRVYTYAKFFLFILESINKSEFLRPEFILWRLFSLVLIILIFMGGSTLLSGKIGSREKFKKLGQIFIILTIFPYLMAVVRNPRYIMVFFYHFRWIKIVLLYFLIIYILYNNESIREYFTSFNEKKVKIIRRKKFLDQESDFDKDKNIILEDVISTKENLDIFSQRDLHEDNKEKTFSNEEKVFEEGEIKKYQFKNGLIKEYYENGALRLEETYVNNILEGRAIEYHPNGRIRNIGYYSKNKKIGKWKDYDEKGILLEEKEY